MFPGTLPTGVTTVPADPPSHLTPEEFRAAGHATIDWIVDYLAGIEDQPVPRGFSRARFVHLCPTRFQRPANPLSTCWPTSSA